MTKRIRCNEYIASLLTKEFSRRLNRIISLGDKATIDNIQEIFRFPGDILLQKMHQSGVLRFDDNVNDMNFWSRLKYTKMLVHYIVIYSENLLNCWKTLSVNQQPKLLL